MSEAIPDRVHFVGVGGSGLSALARVTMGLGRAVTGSDRVRGEAIPDLEAMGLSFQLGHEADLVRGAEMVVATSAIREDLPEIAWARERGIPVYKRHQYLPLLAAGKRLLAVAGTHGKTTTTAILAHVLTETGQDPTAVVGGVLQSWGTNARVGSSELFVLEADEYDRTFLCLSPWLGVITTVEADHPDFYPDAASMEAAFAQFASQCGTLVVNGDDPGVVRSLAAGPIPEVTTFGRGPATDWRLLEANGGPDGLTIRFQTPDGCRRACSVKMWGMHSAMNCLAALAASAAAGAPVSQSVEALRTFEGVRRRFAVRGPIGEVHLVDDYAHHPTEVRAVVDAARQRFPGRRLVMVLQPHTFSRLEQQFEAFAEALRLADVPLVLPVYASRESGDAQAAAAELARAGGARLLPPVAEALGALLEQIVAGDVVLNLGAGDAQGLTDQLEAALGAGDDECSA